MGKVTSQISISLDGFVAGPNQSLENPLGEGGMRLHEWVFSTASWRRRVGEAGGEDGPDSEIVGEVGRDVGAYVMGRHMFGGGSGPWDLDWKGWWGDDPPFHVPVFVLTHHEREPLKMQGGTTFNFVTDGVRPALEMARAAAGDRNVHVPGGAAAIGQFLAAGLLEELHLHIVPVLIGSGARLFENAGDPLMEPVQVIASPNVTHIKYQISKRP